METNRERSIERILPLRPVEFHILLSLVGGERHGYGIVQDAAARGGHSDAGTLYRALRRMRDRGLIEEVGRRVAHGGAAERRRNYRITALGLHAARAEASRLEGLLRAARDGRLLGEDER